uniref:Uncharacterized protein n=1 Tax=Timema shepardi TaxID=629360 RepID=A0A7R9FZA0_TIMSH|nr:unnamed protein product [Timema shepardi]
MITWRCVGRVLRRCVAYVATRVKTLTNKTRMAPSTPATAAPPTVKKYSRRRYDFGSGAVHTKRRDLEKPQGGFKQFPCYSSRVASLVLTDSSQLTSDSQHLAAITASASIFDCVDSSETAWPVAMMMELSHSLTLNEEALQQIPEAKRPVFVFEWLRFLDKVLVAAQKVSVPFLGVLSRSIL